MKHLVIQNFKVPLFLRLMSNISLVFIIAIFILKILL